MNVKYKDNTARAKPRHNLEIQLFESESVEQKLPENRKNKVNEFESKKQPKMWKEETGEVLDGETR